MKIAIIIPCVNLWAKYTRPCIDSIVSSYPYEIHLIDNASTDETITEAQSLIGKCPLLYHRNEVNIGASAAWNCGTRIAFDRGADYVFITNNDILLHPAAIQRLVQEFEQKEEDIVLVSCLDVRGECQNPRDVFTLSDKDKESVSESEHPNFSAFMINRKCWEEVGEFDEEFFPAYFEDNDYHYRIKLAGLKAITYPPAMFYHYGSRTQNEALETPMVPGPMFEQNRLCFTLKWGGLPGQEKFTTPFNDPSKTIKSTKQNS